MKYMQTFDVRIESDITADPFKVYELELALSQSLWRQPDGITVSLVCQNIIHGRKKEKAHAPARPPARRR